MKPFVAVTVLVVASLTAASAAPALQQQVAQGSRGAAVGQSPLLSGGRQLHGGPSFGFGSAPSPAAFGGWFGGFSQGNPFGGSSSSSASGRPGSSGVGAVGVGHSLYGRFPGQASGGNYVFGLYPGVWGQRPSYYYPYGQSFYGPSYGSSWGYGGVYGSGFGGGFPFGFGYGSYSGVSGPAFGSSSGSVGLSQRQAAQGALSSSAQGSRSQRPVARSQ